MKAVRIHQHGSKDVLQIDDLAIPKISKSQCLVNVKAAALNHLDIWVRKGFPGIPLPLIMGSDGAGIIVEIGDEVENFSIGDRVLVQPLTYCDKCKWCNRNMENYCDNWGILGENQNGLQCEYIAIDTKYLRKIPEKMTFEQSAAFPLVAETTYTMLVDRANIQNSETVFIWGASSGVGSMAIQIAKAYNCKVITTVGDSQNKNFAEQLGADFVLNYKTINISKAINDITNSNGVDVVVEHVGAETWKTSMRILGKGGRVVTCGATTGSGVRFDLRHLFYKQQSILGSTMGNAQSLDKALDLFKKGKIKPVVDKQLNMSEIQAAHEYLENGHQIGKIIINIE